MAQYAHPEKAEELILAGNQLRCGRSVGRTLYIRVGDEDSKEDLLIGMVDSPAIAEWIVACCNNGGPAEPLL